MRFVAGAATDVGQVREGNEDAYLVDPRLRVWAVADGMGGHRGGEVASATALEALRAALASGKPLDEAMSDANRAVFEKAADDRDLRGMGTTLTAAVPDEHGVVIGHVGDSRAYILRDGHLERVTVDHSLVEELVREGRLTEEQAAVHPQRSIITRALGVEDSVEVDVYPVALRRGDRVLVCSDGLTSMLRPDEIAAVLRREGDPTRAANLLVDAANSAGGEDNVTVVVLDIEGDDDDPAAGTTTAAPQEGDPVAADPRTASAPAGEEPPAGADVAPGADAHAGHTLETPRTRERRRPARSAGRFLLWALPIVVIFAVAIGAVLVANDKQDERDRRTTTTTRVTTTSTSTTSTTFALPTTTLGVPTPPASP